MIGVRDGRLAFDLPAAQVTPERLDALYANAGIASPQAAGAAPAPVQIPDAEPRHPRSGLPAAPAAGGLAVLVLWPGIRLAELDPRVLFQADSRQAMGGFLAGFWPPAHGAEFLELLLDATLQTLAVATAGMALALLLAVPMSLLASRALSLSAASRSGRPSTLGLVLRWPVRALLVFLRSVPEIVWALLFVRAVGLGPTAGVLAIAITYSGMLGKVYAEIFESVGQRPAHALMQAGAGRLSAFFYGILPSAAGGWCPTPCTAGSAPCAPRW